MKNKYVDDLALLKFSAISDLIAVSNHDVSKSDFFANAAKKVYLLPNGESQKFSPQAIKNWYYRYLNEGYDGLKSKCRKDRGEVRVLSLDVIKEINRLKEVYPHINSASIYRRLHKSNHISAANISKATFYRYMKANFSESIPLPTPRLAFEHEFVNDCWQADTTYSTFIKVNGKKLRTYIIAFIDDHSRFITNIECFFADNSKNMLFTLEEAILKCGVPKVLFVDNGGPYKNKQLSIICAKLGIKLLNARPFSGASKGKIEKFWGGIKSQFLNNLELKSFSSLESFNSAVKDYVFNTYNNSLHSSIKTTPRTRFIDGIDNVKQIDKETTRRVFLFEYPRHVRNDATVNIESKFYEVPTKYIRSKIIIYYNYLDNNMAIKDEKNNFIIIKEVDKSANSKYKRGASRSNLDKFTLPNDKYESVTDGNRTDDINGADDINGTKFPKFPISYQGIGGDDNV